MARTRYLHLLAWCKAMGSYPYYIEQQLSQAEADNAPETAIYKDGKYNEKGEWDPGRWVTIEECDKGTQERIQGYVAQMK